MDSKQIRRRNLRQLINEVGTQARLAELVGTKPTYISQILSPTAVGEIGDSLARRIEKALRKPRGWLDLPHYLPDAPAVGEPGQTYNTAPSPPLQHRVPLISNVQAGDWTETHGSFDASDAESWLPTTAHVSDRAFALRVTGDSMTNPSGNPTIPAGSIVIIDPDLPADHGRIVVALLEDQAETTLKRLAIDGPNRYLMPLNPDYRPIEINGNCRIIGVAVRVEIDLP